jgi:hypothetical protein
MKISLLALALPGAALLLLGCSSNSKGDAGAFDTDGASAGGDADTAAPPDDSDTEVLPDPTWFTLDATLTLEKGALVGGAVRLQIWGEDPSLDPNCASERAVVSATEVDPPDAAIFHWWALETAADDGKCDGADGLPAGFYLGLGALHKELVPALVDHGLDAEALSTTLYGAYASLPPLSASDPNYCGGDADSACVYGYAGTADDFAASGEAVLKAPLPDGTYTVVSAYLFPTE